MRKGWFLFLLLLCKSLFADPVAPDMTVFHGAGSQLGIGAISKVEAEVYFGKLFSRNLRKNGIEMHFKVYDTSEQMLAAFRSNKAHIMIGSSYEAVQMFDELDDQIFAARFKRSSEKQRLLVIVRKDMGARQVTDLAGKTLILERRGGIAEAFLSVILLRNGLPEARNFFANMQIGRFADSAITDVFFGKYDVTVVCEYEYKEAIALNPQIDDVLTVIDMSEPMLMLLGAAHKMCAEQQQSFRQAISVMDRDEEGRTALGIMQAETIVMHNKSELANVKALYDEYQRLRARKPSSRRL